MDTDSIVLFFFSFLNRLFKPLFRNARISGWSPYGELSKMSEEDGRAIRRKWLIEQGQQNYKLFFDSTHSIAGLKVLDVGCGDGYKTWFYATQQPHKIVGADIDLYRIKLGKDFCLDEATISPEFAGASVSSLPFEDACFDVCLMDDVMEHTRDPETSLQEVKRVIRTNGLVYLTFTSFNAAQGGHMSDWIQIPWVHFLFSEKTLAKGLLKTYVDNPNPYILRQFPGLLDQTQGFVFADLNQMTAKRFQKIAKNAGFKVKSLKFTSFVERKPFDFVLNHFLHYLIADYFARRVVCVLEKTEIS